MNSRLLIVALGAAAITASGCAYKGGSGYGHSAYPTYGAQTSYSPYGHRQATVGGSRLELDVGAEQFVDGDLIGGGGAFSNVEYSDAYKRGIRVGAGFANDIRPNTTVTAKGFYKTAEGEDDFVLSSGPGGTVNASVSDYKSYGAELGLRQYLAPNRVRQLRPFVGVSAGAAYIEEVELTSGGVTGVINESGWVPTAAAIGGFEMPVSPTTSIALESGIRWEGSQDRGTFGAVYGDDSGRFSVPLTLRGRFRF